MRFLRSLGLVNSTFDLVVCSLKGSFLLCPHRQDNLYGLPQLAQTLASPRIGIAIGPVFMLIPACANTQFKATMAEHIDGARHLCQERRVAITVAGHHLTEANTFGVASESSHACPAFKGHF